MASQNIQSLALFRAVGQSAGMPAERLGQLSIVSYMIGNPMMALVLGRSGQQARKGGIKPGPEALPQPGKDPAQAALEAGKSAEAAAGSSKNAEAAANAAAASEAKAKEFAEAAIKAAEEAKAAAAKGGSSGQKNG